MKSKILKLLANNLLLLSLCLVMLGAGCEKDETNLNTKSIVGTWQLIPFPDNCVGFRNEKIEITSDSVFKRYINSEMDIISAFSVKTGSLGYDTIFFHNPNAEYEYEEIALIGNDTLHLVSPTLTAFATCDYFKRKK